MSQLTADSPRRLTVTVVGILRQMTHIEFAWLSAVDGPSLPGAGGLYEQPPHDIDSGTDVFATWEAACERSRLSAEHLNALCRQGLMDPRKLRSALSPLASAYARYDAQLQVLRFEEGGHTN
ncbi:hypothetical protein [Streptomyces sp. NPDC017529]|uniref:hypothetical protein n=1 Tax=Streptomyces sp. NPDC017529 TaxID=3365000 RepID=UPI0037A9D6C0